MGVVKRKSVYNGSALLTLSGLCPKTAYCSRPPLFLTYTYVQLSADLLICYCIPFQSLGLGLKKSLATLLIFKVSVRVRVKLYG